jgi:hypothetical protein
MDILGANAETLHLVDHDRSPAPALYGFTVRLLSLPK